ncbi:DUF4129 domain-containing protein [Nocardia donostiensis]|uniref:Protein-glutamine gamma-glutamyltransferase-like C-terminal domain-containing protein n=1 Tax=Nocardia donostiensis TaxID=1538463 RepID=A0A1V2TI25_9NOCA|nr:DUF4129 domain-containing protein [Nocardia donostiensis]ONM49108.1 hypothetical protein B0T46_09275 [Nocardia donostiensis]OQS14126.1 hypothetical protein B0T36_16445 [Nocardia donostiensis]OQS19713.1 hypothetical protein B0T44_12940 [Nocardia donostiensis]
MTDRDPGAHSPPPGIPTLGAAADHRAAAEQAAEQRDFDTALREQFRAVLRGLEQRGVLEVRRSRTARETAGEAGDALPPQQGSAFWPAATSFDEVVYGGRRAAEDEYLRLLHADQFSVAAPPQGIEPVEVETGTAARRTGRVGFSWPGLLRDPRFWATVAAVALIALLLWAVLQSCGAPSTPPPPKPPQVPPDYPKGSGERPDLDPGPGSDSIFDRLPAPVSFGGLQFLIAAILLVWWRARRRGALVAEPRPVEVAANELLAGQAALYRKSGDHEHTAAKLRAATLRRLRPVLGLSAATPPDRMVAEVANRIRADPNVVGAALYGPVPDAITLETVALQLEWIEAEIG